MKRTTKKLELGRTTIRTLSDGQLGAVNGAGTQGCSGPSVIQPTTAASGTISGGTSVISVSISGGTSVISGGH